MSYASILQDLPEELRPTMLALVEAVEQNLRDQLAVRREDLDALRGVVRDLAAAQDRTEQRVAELAAAQDRTEQRVAELAAAQDRTEQRVAELAAAQDRTEQRVAELAAAQDRTEQRVAELAEAQQRTESRLDRIEAAIAELAEAQARTEQRVGELAEVVRQLADSQARMQIRLDRLIGDNLERKYRERAYAYFGTVLQRILVVSVQDVEGELEPYLSEDEIRDLALLDVLVRGNLRQHPDAPEVWLALEVSYVVDRLDVERAQRRAALLQKAGYAAIPAAAGEEVTAGGVEMARANHVLLVQDGRQQYWDEALSRVVPK